MKIINQSAVDSIVEKYFYNGNAVSNAIDCLLADKDFEELCADDKVYVLLKLLRKMYIRY